MVKVTGGGVEPPQPSRMAANKQPNTTGSMFFMIPPNLNLLRIKNLKASNDTAKVYH